MLSSLTAADCKPAFSHETFVPLPRVELLHRRNRSSVHLFKLMPWSAHALGPVNAILNISMLDARSTSTHSIDSNITFLALPSLS